MNSSTQQSETREMVGEYAGFWVRAAAAVLDAVILLIPAAMSSSALPFVGPILIFLLYKPVLEASRAKATIGKRLMGIQVISLEGGKISMKAALIRYVLSSISGLFMVIGHLVMLFTARKQTVHDLVADTLVIYGRNEEPMFEAWIDELKTWFGMAKA